MNKQKIFISSLSFIFKSLIYYFFDTKFLQKIPFFYSEFRSYENLDDAFFYLKKGDSMYELDLIYHQPIAIYFFYWISLIKHLDFLFLNFCDIILINILISDDFFNKKEEKNLEKLKNNFLMIYLFNPIMMIGILTKWTGSFYLLINILGILMILKEKNVLGALLLGLSLSFSFNNIIFMTIVLIISKKKLVFIQIFVFWMFFFFINFILIGNLSFLKNSYLEQYFPHYYEINLSLIWEVFSGSFTRYKYFYNYCFMIFPLFYIIPLSSLFSKYSQITKNTENSFYIGIILILNLLFFQYTTVFDIFLSIFLIYFNFELIFRIKILIILNFILIFIPMLACLLTSFWLNSISGNANYPFFQSLVFYISLIILTTEILSELKKEITKNSIKNFTSTLINEIISKIK